MQVFIVGTAIESARALDKRRLNRQIVECYQILDAISGAKGWAKHPAVLQYKNHQQWLKNYVFCLEAYRKGKLNAAEANSWNATLTRPSWHTQEYYDQMKRRLYTKDPEHYKQWGHLGKSEVNWYYVDGDWRTYKNGKRLKDI